MITQYRMIIFIVGILIAQVVFINSSEAGYSLFGFLDGVPITSSDQLDYLFLLYWYLPVAGLSFFFSGALHEHLMTYGKLIVIRSGRKARWVAGRYLGLSMYLVGIIFVQSLLFFMLSEYHQKVMVNGELILSYMMYFLTLLVLLSIQQLLELYTNSQKALLIINVYIVLSVVMVKELFQLKVPGFFYYFFIPNYGMGFRTSLSGVLELQKNIIYYPLGMGILFILQMGIVLVSMYRLRRMDIL